MNKLSNDHFFLDGYDIQIDKLNDSHLILELLKKINSKFLNGFGKCIVIPCFNNEKSEDDGISGIILGKNFHFTCHTFSRRKTIFVDSYPITQAADLIDILKDYFDPQKIDLCTNNKLTGNFGKHIIIKSHFIPFNEASKLVDLIISKINMHPIYEQIIDECQNGYDILRPIAESHISIHSHNNESIIDIFSCKNYDEQKITQEIPNITAISNVERGIYL